MKKLILIIFLITLTGITGATTVESEEVTVDLENSKVNVDSFLTDLNGETFSYTTSHNVKKVNALINGEKKECNIERLQIGSVIKCDSVRAKNVTANLTYYTNDLIEGRSGVEMFQYRKTFSSITQSFKLNIVLPKGTGILDKENVSQPVVLPKNYEIGSTGRRITVSWQRNPGLGDTDEFQLIYEEVTEEPNNFENLIIGILVLIGGLMAVYIIYRRINVSDLKNEYDELSDDEIDLLELLLEEDGEILQKDAVERSEYSKAKISEVVSSLENDQIIVKTKDGRSNKLKISKKYRY